MIRARKKEPEQKPAPAKEAPSSLETLRRHRITRVKRQNEKLGLELKKTKGELVSREGLVREVLAANAIVRQQFLALPFRLADQMANALDPRECARIMRAAIVSCCNDLAFEKERPPDTCPTCGRAMEGKEEEK